MASKHRDLAKETPEIRQLFSDIRKMRDMTVNPTEIAMGRMLHWAFTAWMKDAHPTVHRLPVVLDESLLTFEVR